MSILPNWVKWFFRYWFLTIWWTVYNYVFVGTIGLIISIFLFLLSFLIIIPVINLIFKILIYILKVLRTNIFFNCYIILQSIIDVKFYVFFKYIWLTLINTIDKNVFSLQKKITKKKFYFVKKRIYKFLRDVSK